MGGSGFLIFLRLDYIILAHTHNAHKPMLFDYSRIESFALRCNECGDAVCICECDGKWAAHCMTCKNCIGHRGYYSPVAKNKYEACKLWNELNTQHT